MDRYPALFRDQPIEPRIPREIHDAHADASELTPIGYEPSIAGIVMKCGRSGAGPGGETFPWSVMPTSPIDASLTSDVDLAIEFKVLSWFDTSAMNGLSLSVNHTEIPIGFERASPSGRICRGIVPRAVLSNPPEHTTLVFRIDHLTPVPAAPTVQLGFAIGWLRIRPR